MAQPSPWISEITIALCLVSILLVPLAVAGLALINNGLGKSRSAAHAMLASLCVIAVAAIVYVAIGFSWEGFAGRAAHVSPSAASRGTGSRRSRSFCAGSNSTARPRPCPWCCRCSQWASPP